MNQQSTVAPSALASETVVRPFWGAFRGVETCELGPAPRTLELSRPDGVARLEPVGRKGGIYETAYHNGRALLECIAALERL